MQTWSGSLWVTGMSADDITLKITQRTLQREGTVQYIIIIITSVLFFTILHFSYQGEFSKFKALFNMA